MKVSNLTRDIQIQYAQEGHVATRRHLASDTGTCADALALLAHDSDETVRRFVAENSSTDGGTLIDLIWDRMPSVVEASAKNPNLPSSYIEDLVDTDAGVPDESLSRMTLMNLMFNPACPSIPFKIFREHLEESR